MWLKMLKILSLRKAATKKRANPSVIMMFITEWGKGQI